LKEKKEGEAPMTLLIAAALIAIMIFSWVCLFKIFPDSLLAMFRFRLWKERDELAREVRKGAYAESKPAEQVVELIGDFIDLAPQLSPLHIGLMRLSEVGMREEHMGIIDLKALSPEERNRLEARLEEVNDLVANHAMLETPSGWGIMILGLPFVPFAMIFLALQKLLKKGYGGSLLGWLRRLFSEGSRELACREHLA
jgi:hypothetical protein